MRNEIKTNEFILSDKYLLRNSVNDVTVRFSLLERNSQDEVTKLWDNIHDLHELANLTTKNLDEIYDKDILKTQNFQIIAEGELTKLKTELGNNVRILGETEFTPRHIGAIDRTDGNTFRSPPDWGCGSRQSGAD